MFEKNGKRQIPKLKNQQIETMQKQNILRYASVKCTNPPPSYKNQALFQNSMIYSKTKDGLMRKDQSSPSTYTKNGRLLTQGSQPYEKKRQIVYVNADRQTRKRQTFEMRVRQEDKKFIEPSGPRLQKGNSEKQFKYITNISNLKKNDYIRKQKPADFFQVWTKKDAPFKQFNNFVDGRLSSQINGKIAKETSVLNVGEHFWNVKHEQKSDTKPSTGYLKRTVKTEADEFLVNTAQTDEKSPQFYRKSYRNMVRKTQTNEQVVKNTDQKNRIPTTFNNTQKNRNVDKMVFQKVFITKDQKGANQNKENRKTVYQRQKPEPDFDRQRYTTNLNDQQRQPKSPQHFKQLQNNLNIFQEHTKVSDIKKPYLNNEKYLVQNGFKKTRLNTEENEKELKSYIYKQRISKTIENQQGEKSQIMTQKPTVDWKKDLVMMEKIGEGTFGKVYKAKLRHESDKLMYAVKKVYIDKKYKSRELEIVQELNHPQVMKVHKVFVTVKEESEQYLNIVMDFYDKNLFEIINENAIKGGGRQSFSMNKSTQLQQKVLIYQILKGLSYIHSLKICHRDIKPHNMLVKGWQLVLCDFGSAKKLNTGEENLSYICSRCYRAPELIFGSTGYTTQIDMWSVACVIIEMLHGMPLFIGENSLDHLLEVIKVVGTPSKQEVLQMNPNYDISEYDLPVIKRKSFTRLFPKADAKLIDLVNKLMIYNPHERLSAMEALAHPYFDELRKVETFNILQGYLPREKLETLFEFSQKQFDLCNATSENRSKMNKTALKEKQPKLVKKSSQIRGLITPQWWTMKKQV